MKTSHDMPDKAPIVIFAFNRLNLLKQTIGYLALNNGAIYSDLTIFIDGPRSNLDLHVTKSIVSFVRTIQGFKSVQYFVRPYNYGLKKNILSGINYMFELHERLIVLEDDLKTSPYFLDYMNNALDIYCNDPKVCQVSGYSYLESYLSDTYLESTYFLLGGDCLAWGTWKRAWTNYCDDSRLLLSKIREKSSLGEFNRNHSYPFSRLLSDNINTQKSWAINWLASTYLLDMLTLYPKKSLARHCTDSSEQGTNYNLTDNDPLAVPLSFDHIPIAKIDTTALPKLESYYQSFLKKYRIPLRKKLTQKSFKFAGILVKYFKLIVHFLFSSLQYFLLLKK